MDMSPSRDITQDAVPMASPSTNVPFLLHIFPSTRENPATTGENGYKYEITAFTVASNWHDTMSSPDDNWMIYANWTNHSLPSTVPPPYRAYWALILLLFPACTIFGNVLVILSVLKFKQLQCAINYFILALAVADCLVAVTVMPFAVYVVVNGDTWEIGMMACDFYMTVDVACSTASILTLTVISFDRYRAVTKPIEYSLSSKNTTRVAQYMTAIWLISILVACPMILGLNKQQDRSSTDCRFNNPHYSLASSCISFGFPLITILFVYARIVMVLRARTKAARLRKASAKQAHMERRTSSVPKNPNGNVLNNNHMHKAASNTRRTSVIPLAKLGSITLGLVVDTAAPSIEYGPRYSHVISKRRSTSRSVDAGVRGKLMRSKRVSSNTMDGSKSMCSIDEANEELAKENTSDSALMNGGHRSSVFSDHASDALLEWTSPSRTPFSPSRHAQDSISRTMPALDSLAKTMPHHIDSPMETFGNPGDLVEVVAETELTFDSMDPLLSVVDVDHPPEPEIMQKFVKFDELHRRRQEEQRRKEENESTVLLTSRTPHLTSTKILPTLPTTDLPTVHSPRSNGRTAHFSTQVKKETNFKPVRTGRSLSAVAPETSTSTSSSPPMMVGAVGQRTVTFGAARSITESSMSKDDDDFYCENSETAETIKTGSSAIIRGLIPFQSKLSLVKNIGVSVVMSSKKKEERSAKRAVVRKEKKATKTLGIVVTIFLICWVPFFWINVQNAVCLVLETPACQVGYLPFFLTTWLGYMNSFLNPIIYTTFNPEFRRAFSHIITCKS